MRAAAPRSAHDTQAGPAPVSGMAAPHVAARFPSLAGRPGGRAQTDAPLSSSDIYSHFASLIVLTPVTRDPDTGTQLRPRRVAVFRAPLRATSGRGGRARTSARGAHRVSQGPGDAFVHSVPTGSPPPGSSLTPRAFLGFKSSAGAVLTRLKTCCVSCWPVWREGSVRPKGPGQGGHQDTAGQLPGPL